MFSTFVSNPGIFTRGVKIIIIVMVAVIIVVVVVVVVVVRARFKPD